MQNKLLFLILALALFLRIFRLEELSSFNYDEARNLIAEREIVVNKDIKLLGPDDHIGGTVIYFGPIHYYLMLPGLILGNFQPLGTYIWTAVLGTLGVLIIYLINKSLLSAAFYAVFPLSVLNSRMDWLPNDILFFAPLYFLFLSKRNLFLAGLFFAFCLQAHTTTAGLILFYFLFKPKKHLHFILGILTGLLPMIIFDLGHDFLYTRGYLSLLTASSHKGFFPHYFLWLVPALALFIKNIPQKIASAAITILFVIIFYRLAASEEEVNVNPRTISKISQIIAADARKTGKSFNVVSFTDPNTRGMSYRYFLSLEGIQPKGVEEYNKSDILYVTTFEKPQTILKTQIYEISSFGPKRVEKIWKVKNSNIYKLTR